MHACLDASHIISVLIKLRRNDGLRKYFGTKFIKILQLKNFPVYSILANSGMQRNIHYEGHAKFHLFLPTLVYNVCIPVNLGRKDTIFSQRLPH